MTAPDPVMDQVGRAIGLGHAGDRAGARALLDAAWAEIGGEGGDPFHRLAVAHSMADVQDDPRDELRWDQRALTAADSLTDARLREGGTDSSVEQLRPSLHLNLADVCQRLGIDDEARRHVALGRDALGSLADDGYRQMISDALGRVAARIEPAPPSPA